MSAPRKPPDHPDLAPERPPPESPRCLIVTHEQADLDGFASLLGALCLHPDCAPVLPGGAARDLRRLFLARPHLEAKLLPLSAVDPAQVERMVLVDCSEAGRLGPLAPLADSPRVVLQAYDHHPAAGVTLPQVQVVHAPTGANSTLIIEQLRARGMTADPELATLLALGIFEDTGGLTYPGVKPRDFLALAWLLERQADLGFVGRFLQERLNPDQIELLGRLLHDLQLLELSGKRILLASLVTEGYVEDAAVLVSRLMDMKQPDAAFVLLDSGARISLIARSRGESGMAVNEIAARLGGGGHAAAASATLHGMTLVEAEESLLAVLHQHLAPVPLARDFMSRPVHALEASWTIRDALDMLGRYPHRGMPVRDESGAPLGYVHRQLLENAMRHGLGARPLADYVESLPVLAERATLSSVRELLGRSAVPMIGVQDSQGHLIGVITPWDVRQLEASHALEPSRPAPRRNLAGRVRGQWGPARESRLRELGEVAASLDMRAYLVGGSVRDLLLNAQTQDVDIVVEGEAPVLARQLQARNPELQVSVHPSFGTATLSFPGGERLDLASSRVEHYPSPAALPRVESSGIQADLWRRDFTINAMAMHIHPERFGELLDPYHGATDLKERRIRVLHSLSFIEDPTRILRALRFELRLGFLMDAMSERLVRNAVHLDVFSQLSGARLWRELSYLLDLPHALALSDRLSELHLWPVLRGEPLADPARFRARVARAVDSLRWYRLLFRAAPEVAGWRLWIRVFWGDLDDARLRQRLREFQLPARELSAALSDVEKLRQARSRLLKPLDPWTRYQLLSPLSMEGLLALLSWDECEILQAQVSEFIQHQYDLRLPLSGKDLQALGIPRGPRIGELLAQLRRAVVEGHVTDRETAKQWIRQSLQASESHARSQPPG
ncbi:CBS domain-containing protein [Thermithiobacillus plumbiphilus]|uniref:CBS domain-containing protein n=1 Tax=Thermithiobacillus plumbiphilus TaxID=1729899 RepID=A0ABU9DBV4_9PROT